MSVELRVCENKTDTTNYETTFFDAGQTFEDHLRTIIPDYEPRPVPMFSAHLNGVLFEPEKWNETILLDGDLIECMVEPKEPTTAAMIIIAVVATGMAIYYANQNIPDNYNTTTPNGSSIYDANAQGNRPKLMGVVPELFGTHKVFPDYVLPPRKEYVGNEEYFLALMAITNGEAVVPDNEIDIGNTPASSFGDDVWAQVFQPGENVSGHPAHKNVYVSPEVGQQGNLELLPSTYFEYWKGGTGQSDDQYQLRIGYYSALETPPENATKTISVRRWTGTGWSEAGIENVGLGEYMEYWSTGPEVKEGIWKGSTRFDPETLQPIVTETFDDVPWDTMVNALIRRFEADGAGGYVGPYYAAPKGAGVSRFRILIRFPEGLCVLNSSGTPQSRSVTVGILWKDVNESADNWKRIVKTYTGSTLDELIFTEEINCPSCPEPVVMLANYTQGVDDIKYKDTVHWYRLESDLSAPTTYSDITTLAIRIKGTNALSSTAENKVSCVPTRKLRHFDDQGNLVFGPTNDLSAAILHLWTDAGNPDTSIDLDELWRLHQVWKARGDEFHGVFDTETTVWEALKRVMAVGFAEPTLDYGQLVPVRDEPQPHINYMYQPDNIIPKSWKMSATLFDESEKDGVEVEYMSTETWKPETILCTLPGEHGLNPEKVRAFGITSRDKAYQFGMRKRSVMRWRRTSHEWATEMDGLNSRYLSPDAIGIEMPDFSQTGRVTNVSGRLISVNRSLEWGTNTHYIGIRRADGTMSGPYICTKTDKPDQVEIDVPLDFIPKIDGTQEPPLFMFGEGMEAMCEKVLIKEIDPQGTERVKLKAVNYDERVFDYDDAQAPS